MDKTLYVVNNMMSCVPLRATLRSVACAKRYRTAIVADGVEENELEGSPCRKCRTGETNADLFMPEEQARTRAGLAPRKCPDCNRGYQPESITQKRCVPCAKDHRRALVRVAVRAHRARKKAGGV